MLRFLVPIFRIQRWQHPKPWIALALLVLIVAIVLVGCTNLTPEQEQQYWYATNAARNTAYAVSATAQAATTTAGSATPVTPPHPLTPGSHP